MNYIKHLNAVFKLFLRDPRLNPTHISLYMALFQYWNINRFPQVFYINREDVMKMSKIGSKATYHRCLKNLHHWKYLVYLPSHNPYKSSQIRLLIFSTSCETTSEVTTDQAEGQVVDPILKHNKPKKKKNKLSPPQDQIQVIDYFKMQGWPAKEAKKFYSHYTSLGWKTSGKAAILDWHSSAEKWMLNAEDFSTIKPAPTFKDHLKISQNKNYDQPL